MRALVVPGAALCCKEKTFSRLIPFIFPDNAEWLWEACHCGKQDPDYDFVKGMTKVQGEGFYWPESWWQRKKLDLANPTKRRHLWRRHALAHSPPGPRKSRSASRRRRRTTSKRIRRSSGGCPNLRGASEESLAKGKGKIMGEVLGALGNFHIWTTLILGPLFIILIIVIAIFLWNYQRGWSTGKGVVLNHPACDPCSGNTCQNGQFLCPGTVMRVRVGDKDETWTMSAISPRPLQKGSKVSVCYDPKAPEKNHTSGTQCMSTHVRDIALGVCVLVAIGAAGWWVTNLVLRKNKGFQQASGVLEGANIASNLFRNNN